MNIIKRIPLYGATVCLLAAVLALVGCGSSSNSDDSASKTTKTELKIAVTANPPSLDPHSVNSNLVNGISSHIYEPLFALDSNYEAQPVLAESYTDNGDNWTIKVRENVKFHNGQTMTADDVVASMNHWVNTSAKAKPLLGGTTFEKVDESTVKMNLNKQTSDVMNVLTSPFQFAAIYPASSLANLKEGETVTDNIGTGPYKLGEWKQDQYIQLDKFDDYTSPSGKASGFTGEKSAATKTLKFMVVTDSSTRINGLKTGEYDVAEDVPAEDYKSLSNESGIKIQTRPSGSLNLFMNPEKGVMANEKLRQAVLAALNCDDIMLAAYGDKDLYKMSCSWMNPDDKTWFTESGKEYYNQNNAEKAKQLISESGYNNEKITLVTTPDYPEMYQATITIQDELKKIGLNAEVESYDFTTFMQKRGNTDTFDLFVTQNVYNISPVQLSMMSKSWNGFDTPELASGIEAIRNAKDSSGALQAWSDLQEYCYSYGVGTVIGHNVRVMATSDKISDFELFTFPIYWNATSTN